MAHGNLSDPSYEPTDAELADLCAGAFSGVRQANEEALARLRERINLARQENAGQARR